MLSSRFLFELVEAQEVIIAANTAVANMCFFITKSIDYLLVLRLWSGYHGALYQFLLLCSRVDGNLLRVSCILDADGSKTGLQGEDLLEVEPLVCRVRVMVLRVVFCACCPLLNLSGRCVVQIFLTIPEG